jgi:hypothetical protein
MKKFIFLFMILPSGQCLAATGSASDGEIALLTITAILLLPVLVVYLFHLLKHRINDFRMRRLLEKHSMDHNGNPS